VYASAKGSFSSYLKAVLLTSYLGQSLEIPILILIFKYLAVSSMVG